MRAASWQPVPKLRRCVARLLKWILCRNSTSREKWEAKESLSSRGKSVLGKGNSPNYCTVKSLRYLSSLPKCQFQILCSTVQ